MARVFFHMVTVTWRWDLIRCRFPATRNIVFTIPINICHAALAAFIDNPDLFRHGNTHFASGYHNLSSLIVVK
jgi:hypothetical protein